MFISIYLRGFKKLLPNLICSQKKSHTYSLNCSIINYYLYRVRLNSFLNVGTVNSFNELIDITLIEDWDG